MSYARTQIYLDPLDHKALLKEASERGVSLAELVRQIVRGHLDRASKGRPSQRQALRGIVSLGASGKSDVSERHDEYLGKALRREHPG